MRLMETKIRLKGRKGFTLVELAVVIVIIGVLAAFGIPRFLQSVERSKAAEAFAYLAAVRSAQERYNSLNGTYASSVTNLDLQLSTPKYFTADTTFQPGGTSSLEDSWSLTLTRTGSSSGFKSGYTVVFTDQGFDATNSTIPADINPQSSGTTSTSSSSSSSSGS
jgi:prepilin-type N-terminal cleavage/methylation domain-containing protein